MKIDDAPHPSNIEWKNIAASFKTTFFLKSLSLIFSIALIVILHFSNSHNYSVDY